MGKRVFLVAAVLAAAALALWTFERAGAAAPAFVEQGKLQAADGAAQDSLGFSVAVSGDTAVVGAPADAVGANSRQGSAYVYVRNGSTWTQQQKLTASDGVANDEFGYAVAIAGDTIFVGRHFTQAGNNARTRGAVYVFTRTGSTWTQSGTLLTPSDAADGDLFGASLAVDAGTLVVGALQKNNGSTFFQGAAYVFTGSGAAWTQQAKLLAGDGGFANFFGFSVAVSGDTVVVGATGQAGVSADGGRGAAYVFTRGGTAWAQQQKLLASDGAAGDAFGFSVGVSGDTAVVGARLDTVGAVGGQGSAYVFARSGVNWTEQQHLFGVEATQRNDTFGASVAVRGDVIAVGAPAHEFQPGVANHGAVYLFARSGSTWTRQQKLLHSDFAPDALGSSVAFDGASVVAGAPAKNSARGAAYVFVPEVVDPNRVNGAETTQASLFGENVDIDGDTAVVGAAFDEVNGVRAGAAYVFVRNGSAWTQQARLVPADGAYGDDFGRAVAVSGNTVVVGAYDNKVGGDDSQGAAYVYVRTGTTWSLQQKLVASDGEKFDSFGLSVDVDGDTAVVGALSDDINATNDNRGSAYAFARSGSTWTQQGKFTADAGTTGSGFGSEVAVSGDTAIVGSPVETVGTTANQGAAYVFRRTGATWAREQRIVITGVEPGDLFGNGVDVDGDTAVIGAAQGFSAASVKGAVYVYTRAGAVWTQQQKLLSSDLEFNDYFGRDVSVSGDTLVAGAFGDRVTDQGSGEGSAYVFKRAGTTWTEQRKLTATDGSGADFYGQHVAVSGDTVIVGAKGDDVAGKQEQGSAYIYSLTNGATPTPTASPTPTATGSVSFTTSTVQAEEGPGGAGMTSGVAEWWQAANAAAVGAASLTVTRTDATQAATVDYATADGTASARSDYTASFGTLRFAAGETSKSIVIQVTDDRFQESVESFSVVLSNPVGVSLGSPSSATVQVTSDDAATGPNPVADASFDVDFFVRQHYADFLGREADAAGLTFWKSEIAQCETRPEAEWQPCREVKRVNVSAAFFLSIEFQQTGYFVYLLHQAAYASGERLASARFHADAGEVRRGVVVGATGWEGQLAANKQAFALAFVQRPEFANRYPAGMTPAQFVDALNANAGGSLSQAERDARVAELTADNTNAGRASVLLKLTDDADFRQREFNKAFVLMQYFGYLRRAPNESPDTNFEG
ncbi:MAG TPA: Calx-beta domain-containing protein, partial [Pyrinomonadaceae bacterium]